MQKLLKDKKQYSDYIGPIFVGLFTRYNEFLWVSTPTTDTGKLNPKFFAAQIQISIPNRYFGSGYELLRLIFCRSKSWIMENMDNVPKWVLIVWPKILQMPQNLSARFVCTSRKILDLNEKRLHWASVVRD